MSSDRDARRIRAPLDWRNAYARLRSAEERINAIDLRSQEEIEALVRARARQLEALANAPPLPDAIDLVILLVAGERYAFDVKEASEAIAITHVTALPGVPTFFRGLISHRGSVYPLLDIRPLVGGALLRSVQFSQAILFTSGGAAVAVGAHAVESLQRVDVAGIDGWQAADGAKIVDMRALIADVRLVVDDRIGVAEHSSSGDSGNAG
ncbi:MAG TPA: chemotaxis protein CheW [Candidatus Baltobacteraceae bacterium]